MDHTTDNTRQALLTHAGMGTTMTHMAYGRFAPLAVHAVRREMSRLEKLLSRFKDASDISRINHLAGRGQVKVGSETFLLLSLSQQVSILSGGAFDITCGPLIKLWDYKQARSVPEESKIQQALQLTGYVNLSLDESEHRVMLKNIGQAIDLGGVAKGYASDRAMEIFKRYGIRSAFTNIGGNVSTLGTKPDGTPFKVGIRHPREENQLIGCVSVTGKAVVTSGDYERYYIDPFGKRRHHLISPMTGYPAESGLISVTVTDASAMLADALSTAVFVLGLEKGLSLLNHFPLAEAVLVDEDIKVHVTKGLKDVFMPARGIRADA